MTTSTAPAQVVALFTNFEGVLHTPALDDFIEFEFLPELENVLRDYPQVFVVVMSEVRNSATIHQLREPFSPDIRPRIMGVTPELVTGRARETGRVSEIEAYLKEIGGAHLPWVAIDFDALVYPPEFPRLVLTHRYIGFNEDSAAELRAKLDAIVGPQQAPAQVAAPDTRTLAEKEGALAQKPAAPEKGILGGMLARLKRSR